MNHTGPESVEKALGDWRDASEPGEALAAARALRQAADELERAAILAARRAGMSWTRIGAVYGLTKQGAQQRFKRGLSDPQ